jgi:hypothetical protein
MSWLGMYCISAESNDLTVVLIILVFYPAPVLEVCWKFVQLFTPPAFIEALRNDVSFCLMEHTFFVVLPISLHAVLFFIIVYYHGYVLVSFNAHQLICKLFYDNLSS